MLSPPTVWRQQCEFVSSRQSGQIPAAVCVGFGCRCNVAISMDTHVGLNVATRVCDVYPDKCWFAVLCRFLLQCSLTLRPRSYWDRLNMKSTVPELKIKHLLIVLSALYFSCEWNYVSRTAVSFVSPALTFKSISFCNTKKLYVSKTVFIITQGNTRATCFD